MLIVPGSFVGHSVVCDKCGVTFLAMPSPQAQPQYSAPPPSYPLQMPPAHQPIPYSAAPPMSPPPPSQAPFGYGAPSYSQPPRHPSTYHGAQPQSTSQSLPSAESFEAPPLPTIGGEYRAPPHPFGNPLPEIEILPPPKAKRQSSRKRSGERSSERSSERSGERSGEGKRSRRRSSRERPLPTAPPPLPAPPSLPRADGRVSHTALARADHGPSGEISEIEQRIRRAQLRRTMSLAFAVVGLLVMSVMGLLMIKFAKPSTAPPPAAAPAAEPKEAPEQPTSSEGPTA
jgi:hypothetical protein